MNCPHCSATNVSAGHIMGHSKSEAKTAAARANAKKPRPRHIPLDERSRTVQAMKESGAIARSPDTTESPSVDLQGTSQPDEFTETVIEYDGDGFQKHPDYD